jgi:hypothetical protein
MRWLGWLKKSGTEADEVVKTWRRDWNAAVDAPDAAQAADLRARLTALGPGNDERELEREMLEALDALLELAAEVEATGPPIIVTGHKAAGTDRCHFAAPASLPDNPAHPTGTLLLTNSRAVFVGGSHSIALPWHIVTSCARADRDLLLVLAGRSMAHRVRHNSYTDALRAQFLARHLSRRSR